MKRSSTPNTKPERLSWLEMAWALHTEKQGLVDSCLHDYDWNLCKEIGLALWCNDQEVLKKVVEKIGHKLYTLKKKT